MFLFVSMEILICLVKVVILLLKTISEMAAKKASLLSEMHLRNLRQKMQLKQRTEEVVKRLEVQAEVY